MSESVYGITTEDHIRWNRKYGVNNYKPLDVVIERGKGVWVWDIEGNKYMDFLSAYSCQNTGYSHPKIVKAVVDQAKRCGNVSRAFLHDKQGPFMKKLAVLCGKDCALPMNTGAEAVETAIKAARKWGLVVKGITEPEIIVFANNFHGRTTTIVGFSTEEHYREGFGPFAPGFKIVPYGDIELTRCAVTENTVGILFEPIQGEAGIIIPPDGFLRGLRKLCTENKILMMADEIQTGLGRTGKLFACDHENIVPDLYIIGKALGGGLVPVSAVVGNRNILDVFDPGSHGSTFGGYSLGCAAGLAALDVIVDEGLCERSAEMGEYFQAMLRWHINSSHIKEVRGRGLMIGLELNTKARPFCEALMKEDLLCKETHDKVIRLAPPLVITKKQIDWAMKRIKKVLEA